MLGVDAHNGGFTFTIYGFSGGRRTAPIAAAFFPAMPALFGMNAAAAADAAYAAGKAWARLYGAE